jgi:hypothetical protein
MRRLPWLVNKDDSDVVVEKSLKRKRRMTPDIPSPQVPTPDPVNSDSEETVVDSSDQAMDVMIPGYNNDDAYIMVEDDFLAAARQVTRHLHQEAYQRHSTTTVTREITRPTIGKPRPRTPVEGETDESSDGEGEDMSTLGELLRRRPPTPTVAATPIKRRQVVAMRPPSPLQRGISPPMRNRPVVSTSAIHVAETCATDDDEDDEDLDKPPKKVYLLHVSLTCRSHASPLKYLINSPNPQPDGASFRKPLLLIRIYH